MVKHYISRGVPRVSYMDYNANALPPPFRSRTVFTHVSVQSNQPRVELNSMTISLIAVQSLSHVQLFATPWTAARQASLSFTISQSLLKLMSIETEKVIQNY